MPLDVSDGVVAWLAALCALRMALRGFHQRDFA